MAELAWKPAQSNFRTAVGSRESSDICALGITAEPHFSTPSIHVNKKVIALIAMATSSTSHDWLNTTLNQAQPWITECLSKHVDCRSTTPRRIPTRLVDVGPSDGSKNPFLFVPAATCSAPPEGEGLWTPTPDSSFRYLALSYCWGTQGNLMTTPENVDARRAGIAWDEIPQTIKDAVLVTRKLG